METQWTKLITAAMRVRPSRQPQMQKPAISLSMMREPFGASRDRRWLARGALLICGAATIVSTRSVLARPPAGEAPDEAPTAGIGQASRFGEAWVRPHDLRLSPTPGEGSREAMVDRVAHLGFEVRAELVRDDGEPFAVQLTRDEAEQLELAHGQIVYVRPTRETTFA